ncbi:unnamed protein product [Closterium sp. Yama58-4]|nr:unnamed protein product [Closterium sp. Yama58-4]
MQSIIPFQFASGCSDFIGSIPETISNLKQLRELRLGEQMLSGPIPESIGALTNLELIWLEGNGLSGNGLSGNSLSGNGLSGNSLSGTIPASIAHLTALTTLCAHSPSTRLSPILPPPASLPFSLHPPLSHSPSTRLSPILPPPASLPFSLHPPLSHSPNTLSFPSLRKLNDNRLAGTIPLAITTLTNLAYLHLDSNQLTGELPSFHHMPHLTSLDRLSAAYNYLTATADAFPFNTTSPDPDDPSEGHSACLFTRNCLESSRIFCGPRLKQRRDSECLSFCGVQAQPLTPPCSGHGMCSFVPDPSLNMAPCYDDEDEIPPSYCDFEGQCTCDEGYTPGTAAGMCVSHDTLPVPQGTNFPFEPPGTSVVGVVLSDLQAPKNHLLLLLLLLPPLLLAFSLPHLLRRLWDRPPTRYYFSKRALAARQAAMGVEIS